MFVCKWGSHTACSNVNLGWLYYIRFGPFMNSPPTSFIFLQQKKLVYYILNLKNLIISTNVLSNLVKQEKMSQDIRYNEDVDVLINVRISSSTGLGLFYLPFWTFGLISVVFFSNFFSRVLFPDMCARYCGVAPRRSLRMWMIVLMLFLGLPALSCKAGFSVPEKENRNIKFYLTYNNTHSKHICTRTWELKYI